jgi:hypothetical protein
VPSCGYEWAKTAGGGLAPSVSVPSPKASSQCTNGTLSCATIENWTLTGTGPEAGSAAGGLDAVGEVEVRGRQDRIKAWSIEDARKTPATGREIA